MTSSASGSSVPPRYFVTLFLRGGIDAVYTVDPKTRAQVDAKVDVPYDSNAILTSSSSNLQLGPHLAPVRKWADKMAIVRGVQVHTANHETGATQVLRMRTNVTSRMPSLHDVIGQSRAPEQAISSVTLGDLTNQEYSAGALTSPTADPGGRTVLETLDDLSDEDIAVLARVYANHIKRVPKWQTSLEAERTKEHLSQAAAFFERMKTTPRFKPESWTERKGKAGRVAEDLQRVLWFLENDLAKGVYVRIYFGWDSHTRNTAHQAQASGSFMGSLDRFLTELHTRRNAHGTLAEQTVLVIGSELGRFPIINGNEGKDHFPECPYVFMGPTVNSGEGKGIAFVETDKMMAGTPVSLTTGRPEAGGSLVHLDDIGTTLVHMAGMKPELYGYNGRRLKFLERA